MSTKTKGAVLRLEPPAQTHLTVQETAEYIGIASQNVRKAILTGRLRATARPGKTRWGKHYIISRAEAYRYALTRVIKAAGAAGTV